MASTVLVVEDDTTSRDMLAYLLGKAGYVVCTAADGMEGLEQARSQHPDLIVMDVQMPVLDGYQAAMECKSDPLLRRIPIVAVTAVAMVGDREKVLAAGFDAYITKPIVPEDFVAQIEGLLPEGRRAEPAVAESRPDGKGAPAAVVKAPRRMRTGRILVVDDRVENSTLLAMILESSGYEVAVATNGPDALIAARSVRPHLVMSDIHLAQGTGYDLVAELRLDEALSAIPVVLISSSLPLGPPGDRHLKMGAQDLIVRPIDPDELLARVAAVLVEEAS